MVYGSGLENQRGESLREFESHPLRFAFLAQLVVRDTCNIEVAGSSPVEGFLLLISRFGFITQLVEYRAFNLQVVSSSLTKPT